MNVAHLLKGLESQLHKAESEVALCKVELLSKQKEYDTLRMNLNSIKEKISKLTSNTEIIISEHALLRYIERVLNIDIEEISNSILTDQFKTLVYTLGDGKIPLNNDFTAIVKDNVVTTIIPNKS